MCRIPYLTGNTGYLDLTKISIFLLDITVLRSSWILYYPTHSSSSLNICVRLFRDNLSSWVFFNTHNNVFLLLHSRSNRGFLFTVYCVVGLISCCGSLHCIWPKSIHTKDTMDSIDTVMGPVCPAVQQASKWLFIPLRFSFFVSIYCQLAGKHTVRLENEEYKDKITTHIYTESTSPFSILDNDSLAIAIAY